MADRVALTVAQVVDVLTTLQANPWIIVVGVREYALGALRRDRGSALADSIEIEYVDPRVGQRRHGSLTDYARAVVAHAGLGGK